MITYYLLFIFIILLSITANIRNKTFIVVLVILILSLFAGTRVETDADYPMYYDFFYYIEDSLKKFRSRDIPLEWSIYLIPNFFKIFFTSNLYVARASLLVFATLGVTTKVIAIRRYSEFFALSMMVYVSNLFLIQEMTTIRAGVASGIFLLAVKDLDRKNLKGFAMKMVPSFIFHNSSILFVASYFLQLFRFKIKYYYLGLVFSFLFAILKLNVIKLLFLDRIFPRVEIYLRVMEWKKEEAVNIFNFRIVFALFFFGIFAIFYKKLKEIKYFDTLFKVHIFSLCIFFLLSTSAEVFSLRGFELLSVVQILLYPMIVNVFQAKTRIIAWAIILTISIFQVFYLINISDIYTAYESWLTK